MSAPGGRAPVHTDGHRCLVREEGPKVNGVRIDPVTRAEFVATVESYLKCGRSHVLHFCSAHPTVEARHDPAYRDLLNRGNLNLPDGLPVAWAARLSGRPGATRLPGTEGMQLVARWGLGRSLRHYLYGSTVETLELMKRRLAEDYPGIDIVGSESPPFRPLSDEEIEESGRRMRDAGAEAVWVGLGAPKQDVMAERLRDLQAAPAIFCVGAAFDFVAGLKKRAPDWMQRAGLEWLHRLASEPGRLWRRYLIGNPQFVAGVLVDRVRSARTGRR